MFNTVIISGRLTADVEIKQTPTGLSVCNFSIANETGYGEKKQTSFISCVAWRGTAENISKYFGKGSMIGIEGKIQERKFTDKEGKNRSVVEILVNNFQFMEGKKDAPKPDLNVLADSLAEHNVPTGFEEIPSPSDDDLPF